MRNEKLARKFEKKIRKVTASKRYFASIVSASATKRGYTTVKLENGQNMDVVNRRTSNTPGKVILGYDNNSMPGVLQILGTRETWGDVPSDSGFAEHHETHEYPGADTVYVQRDQFIPLLVLPVSEFVVQIYGNVMYSSGTWYKIKNQQLDLAAHKPTTGALYVLLQANSAGVVTIKDGVAVGGRGALSMSKIPAPDAGNYPLCAVALYDGQELLQRDTRVGKIDDFFDLRFSGYATAGAGFADMLKSIYDPQNIADDAFDFANMTGTDGVMLKETYDPRGIANDVFVHVTRTQPASPFKGMFWYDSTGDIVQAAIFTTSDNSMYLGAV